MSIIVFQNVIIKMGRKKEKESKNTKIKLRVKLNHLEDGTVATVESATRVLRSNKTSSDSFKSLKDGSKKSKRKRNQKQLKIHDDRDQEHYDNEPEEEEEEEPLTLIPFCKWNEETKELSEVVTAEELFPLNFEKPTRPIVGFSLFDVQKLTSLPSPENFKIKKLIKEVKSKKSKKVNIAKTKKSKAGRSEAEVKGAEGSVRPNAKTQLVSQGEVSSRGRPIKRTFKYAVDADDSEEELAPNDEDYIDSDESTVVSEEEQDD
ncbi:hypothetical protein T11_1147 [Trichinella zimbabwensis]|uniref:Uncharacterized protein n=2 Tax=Trichinella zimbabwensis TaxID=268475 RepID=A0A0V1HZX5_9BILA|nr:hypothetical protein T11_1147 [Trichinella zimbabwensis]